MIWSVPCLDVAIHRSVLGDMGSDVLQAAPVGTRPCHCELPPVPTLTCIDIPKKTFKIRTFLYHNGHVTDIHQSLVAAAVHLIGMHVARLILLQVA